MTVTESEIMTALSGVYDPCSQSWQRPLSVVDLGLVRGTEVDDNGRATVRLSLTSPFCMALATIMQSVERRVGELPGVTSVAVEVDPSLWTPDLMSPEGRTLLAEYRGPTAAARADGDNGQAGGPARPAAAGVTRVKLAAMSAPVVLPIPTVPTTRRSPSVPDAA